MWQARRDRPARSVDVLIAAARPQARDATPRSPAPSTDLTAQQAAQARTGFGPQDRQTTRPRTISDSTTEAEANHRQRSTNALLAAHANLPPHTLFARTRPTWHPSRPAPHADVTETDQRRFVRTVSGIGRRPDPGTPKTNVLTELRTPTGSPPLAPRLRKSARDVLRLPLVRDEIRP
jgi:hypothetical protein